MLIIRMPDCVLVFAPLLLDPLLDPSSETFPPCGLVLIEGSPNPVEPGWVYMGAAEEVAVPVADTTVLPPGYAKAPFAVGVGAGPPVV